MTWNKLSQVICLFGRNGQFWPHMIHAQLIVTDESESSWHVRILTLRTVSAVKKMEL